VDFAFVVEKNRLGGRGALVDGQDECHARLIRPTARSARPSIVKP
jgi:hypothetical protein